MEKSRLLLDDRINLQAAIGKNFNLKECALLLKKSRSTIYREITNNSYYKPCRHSCSHCEKYFGKCEYKSENGFKECSHFIARRCMNWLSFPYTCNGCEEREYCTDLKRYYDCIEANELSKKKRKEPRTYHAISTEDELYIDEILIECVRLKGQSLHHVYVSHPLLSKICCERTIRRYIYKGYMTVKAHELPRYVRFSHKYDYTKKKIINVERMLGRTYTDYLNYVKEHPNYFIWQYDSVEGKIDDKKAILTITFPKTRFQFGILISKQNSKSCYRKLLKLRDVIGVHYEQIFQINISDNGPEFAKFHELENDACGNQIIKTFFTNPYRSTDKAECERNHEFIRYFIPKGVGFDFLTQEKVNLMFSHINSYVRASNKNKTPYELTVEIFGEEFMNAIGIKKIDKKDVCLKPSLIRTKKK